MNNVLVFLVCGHDYDDHVNDRAYFSRRDAEARKQHLEEWCEKVPKIEDPLEVAEDDAMDVWEKLDRDIIAFCIEHDYPRDMESFTKFGIEEIQVFGEPND
jgi:hypothetical protein